MICAGDVIEQTVGGTLHLSTLAAAGLGNLVSDVAGIGMSSTISDAAASLGVSTPKLSDEQLAMGQCRAATAIGQAVGISIGCLLGMFPLLFIDGGSCGVAVADLSSVFEMLAHSSEGLVLVEDVVQLARLLPEVSPAAVDGALAQMGKGPSDYLSLSEFLKVTTAETHPLEAALI